MSCSIVFSLLLPLAASAEVALSFELAGKEVRRATAAQISAEVPAVTVRFEDPMHGKLKSYRCWPIKALMDFAYGPKWGQPPYTEAVLTAAQ